MAGVNVWGSVAGEGFALPMVSLTPSLPQVQAYTLAWDLVQQALAYVPVAMDSAGNINASGEMNIAANKVYRINTTQVVGARKTGWAALTGTATRSTFATGTATTQQVAEALKALIDDLTSHGLIGA
jgi:hypothetical protein